MACSGLLLVGVLLLGCGAAAPSLDDCRQLERTLDDEGVVAGLGCDDAPPYNQLLDCYVGAQQAADDRAHQQATPTALGLARVHDELTADWRLAKHAFSFVRRGPTAWLALLQRTCRRIAIASQQPLIWKPFPYWFLPVAEVACMLLLLGGPEAAVTAPSEARAQQREHADDASCTRLCLTPDCEQTTCMTSTSSARA